MAKNDKPQVVTELEQTKRSHFMVDPFKLHIIGIDGGGPGDPGYDERVKAPLRQAMVDSIKESGVIVPVQARTDGERMVIVDGRQRVMHARAANLQLQTANPGIDAADLIKVPTFVVRGDEDMMFQRQELANAYRFDDPPDVQARKIQDRLDKGWSEDKVMRTFNISKSTLDDRLKLLNLAPEALKELQSGNLTTNAAIDLAGVTMAEQVKVLAMAREEAIKQGRADGKLSTRTVQAGAANAKADGGSNKPTRKTPTERVKAVSAALERAIFDFSKAHGSKAFGPDGKSAKPLEPAEMHALLRKVYKEVTDRTWDKAVKTYVDQFKADADAEEEKLLDKAPKAATK